MHLPHLTEWYELGQTDKPDMRVVWPCYDIVCHFGCTCNFHDLAAYTHRHSCESYKLLRDWRAIAWYWPSAKILITEVRLVNRALLYICFLAWQYTELVLLLEHNLADDANIYFNRCYMKQHPVLLRAIMTIIIISTWNICNICLQLLYIMLTLRTLSLSKDVNRKV